MYIGIDKIWKIDSPAKNIKKMRLGYLSLKVTEGEVELGTCRFSGLVMIHVGFPSFGDGFNSTFLLISKSVDPGLNIEMFTAIQGVKRSKTALIIY